MENLTVEMAYFYPKENAVAHKTDKFELVHDEDHPIPILRRGLKFTLAVRFMGRSYQKGKDIVKLIFNFGNKPNPIKGTKATMRVVPNKKSENKKEWHAEILSESADTLSLEVHAAPDCPVGNWTFQIETSAENSTLPPSIYNHISDVYILFNPWNCSDLVYMPDERLLDEYVLTDVGKIWLGPWTTSRGREWVFGQFDGCVLLAAMAMFERASIPDTSRGDPIKITRCISKMVNSNDDDGILVGRWDGDYIDGTAPSAWIGSVPILQEYLDNEKPVQYGQCWVFSGVCTTICRALGIPSRVVSNLVSAHDANASLTVDKYYNTKNEEIDFDPLNPVGEDSIWNYHVWNDVWMARPDLPKGYGGWQAIDATPQETSSGFYQCGPAPLEAIKQGAVCYNYDVPFMVASVNADLMRWKEDPTCDLGYSKIYCNRHHIGRFIYTKQPWIFDPNGDKDREDITLQYKPKEGTKGERLSLYNAVRGTELAKSFYALPEPGLEDIHFELQEIDKIKIGDDFCLTVNIKNNGKELRSIKAVLSAGSVFYTGVKANLVKKAEGSFKLKPKSSETLRLSVKSDEYLDKLVEYCIMKIYVIASVEETRQTWADEDDFQVVKPTIVVTIPTEIPESQPSKVILRFVNPLKKILTNCKFNISGSALIRNQVVPHADVKPGGLLKVEAQVIPKSAGEQKIIATFASKELVDITGSALVNVYEE